jgi:hypothetical protein
MERAPELSREQAEVVGFDRDCDDLLLLAQPKKAAKLKLRLHGRAMDITPGRSAIDTLFPASSVARRE